MIRAVILLVVAACAPRPEQIAPAPDASVPAFDAVEIGPSRVLLLGLRGADFEDARGKGCPLEAVVEEPDAGQSPILRFRCAAYGGP